MTDPLSQFMGLYSLLLALCSDSQEQVDQFVLTVQPGIPTNTPFKSRKSGVQETVYTKLRNEIGHVRAGTTLDGTRNEMKTQIPGLIDVVRQLVSKQP